MIAKSLGVLLSPFALSLAPIPNPEMQIVHTWKLVYASMTDWSKLLNIKTRQF